MTDGLPIKIDATSNGEYAPLALDARLAHAQDLARARIADNARRTGHSRRSFLAGLSAAATTLLTFNEAFAARGNLGGAYRLLPDAALDPQVAAETLAGDEFIFDVQTHMVEPDGAWRSGPMRGFARSLARFPNGKCGEDDPVDCFSPDHFIKDVFLDSDTAMAVMSFIPAPAGDNPLSMAEANRVARLIDAADGGNRLLLHNMVLPNNPPLSAQLDRMEEMAATYPIAAWKTYTEWGPDRRGWWLDGEFGLPFIEKARALGIRNICIHKGLPFGTPYPAFATCRDVGVVARMFPDVNFIIYHSGLFPRRSERAYDAANAGQGVDNLIKSVLDNGIAPNANVYAELGSTWRILMRDPTGGAHVLGKLMRFIGEKNILWGTDSIWYGSPQDQIQAFRAFEISEELQERHGYPSLTAEVKRSIFGLNGAQVYNIDPADITRKAETDRFGRMKQAYLESPDPSFATYGPRDRREFLHLRGLGGGTPE